MIASYLEDDLVARIAAEDPRAHVTYEPALVAQAPGEDEHVGQPPSLSADELEGWLAITAAAEVMFDFDWHDPAGLPGRCRRLRWIQAPSAGIGEFMAQSGLDRSGITVTTAAGTHAVALAELALMGALHFVKGMPRLDAWKAQRHWQPHTTERLAGRRALVVGLGGIGRKLATTFAAVGVDVWGLARRGERDHPAGVTRTIARDQLLEVLPLLDILILACPLTEATRGMIGVREIAALPAHAIVINVGRGAVIDEPALSAALSAGRLKGACLDVFSEEPLPAASPLWGLDNVIISPHSAAAVTDQNEALTELFIDNLSRYLDGRELRNLYDPAAGY
ncbi:MAG: D-2-hydroxyacid dehydrogenase [Solirubrobacteraceae bacterium]